MNVPDVPSYKAKQLVPEIDKLYKMSNKLALILVIDQNSSREYPPLNTEYRKLHGSILWLVW